MVKVTQHAYDRFKQRLGLNRKAADRMAEKVYVEGVRHSDTDGKLFKYIATITHKGMIKGDDIRLYGDVVYCFVRQGGQIKLCTLYQMPKKYREVTHKKQKQIVYK